MGQKITHKVFQQVMGFILNSKRKLMKHYSNNFILKYMQEDQDLAPLILKLAEDYLFRIERF